MMSIKKTLYFCLRCYGNGNSFETVIHRECLMPIVVKALITFERNRTQFGRFIGWLLEDITFYLAFMGAIIINTLLLPHFNLTFRESCFESFCLGLVLIRLFRDEKNDKGTQ